MNNPLLRFHKWIKKTSKRGKEYWRSINLGVYSLREIRYSWKTGEPYKILNLNSEKDLVTFIKTSWGYGSYSVIGHLKRRNGAYVFWKGEITSDGWCFTQKETLNAQEKKEIDEYQRDINIAEDDEEVNVNKMLIDMIKTEAKERKSRYGFYPFLKSSGLRGSINFWNEDSLKIEESNNPNIWVTESLQINKQPKKKFESLTLDEINKI